MLLDQVSYGPVANCAFFSFVCFVVEGARDLPLFSLPTAGRGVQARGCSCLKQEGSYLNKKKPTKDSISAVNIETSMAVQAQLPVLV